MSYLNFLHLKNKIFWFNPHQLISGNLSNSTASDCATQPLTCATFVYPLQANITHHSSFHQPNTFLLLCLFIHFHEVWKGPTPAAALQPWQGACWEEAEGSNGCNTDPGRRGQTINQGSQMFLWLYRSRETPSLIVIPSHGSICGPSGLQPGCACKRGCRRLVQ